MYCSKKCATLHQTKFTASLDEIKTMAASIGFCATGRHYGVSDNAIRKRIKKLENSLTTPRA
jgi:hypothetical protein